MQRQEDFQEIESMGEDGEYERPEEWEEREKRGGGGSLVPLLQVALCALILIALAILKYTDAETYGKAAAWYESEAAREIELPSWNGRGETGEAPAEASAGALGDGSLRRV